MDRKESSSPSKGGSGQSDTPHSILFLIAIEPLTCLLATAFVEIIHTSQEGVLVGPLLF
jgi:hypothetical protein